MKFECSFTVKAPIEKVYAFFGDNEESHALFPEFRSRTILSGDGKLSVGTTVKLTQVIRGRTIEQICETLEVIPFTKIVMRIKDKNSENLSTLTFSKNNQWTFINWIAEFRFLTLLYRVLQHSLGRQLKGKLRERIGRIRSHIEGRVNSEKIEIKVTLAGMSLEAASFLTWLGLVALFTVAFQLLGV